MTVTTSQMIRDWLTAGGTTQTALAHALGCTDAQVSDMVNGNRNVSPNMAIKLERVTGIYAEEWMVARVHEELKKARMP